MFNLKTLLLCLSLVTILGCGGGQGNSNSTADSSTPATLSEYQFSAMVDIAGTPPFPVAIGDTVTGTFTFDPDVKDNYVLSTQGGYFQKFPASVQVKIGSVILNADLNNWLGYRIEVIDNDDSVMPVRDELRWYVNDTALAASYGLDYIQLGFGLQDLTATAFNSDVMPVNIDLNDYTGGTLFISGSKGNATDWHFRSKITSIVKVQ